MPTAKASRGTTVTALGFRRLTPSDLLAFRALRQESFRLEPGSFISTPEDEAALAREEVERRLAHNFGFGAFDGESLIANAGLTWFDRPKLRHKAEIHGVYVRAAYRGRGVGDGLLGPMLDYARGRVEAVNLTVSAGNLPAIRLYERWGFERYGLEPRALKLPDGGYIDDLLMVKRLT